jgi:hypothetical protein
MLIIWPFPAEPATGFIVQKPQPGRALIATRAAAR